MSKQILPHSIVLLLYLGKVSAPNRAGSAFCEFARFEPQAIIGFFKTNAPDLLDEIMKQGFSRAMDIFIARWRILCGSTLYRGEDQA